MNIISIFDTSDSILDIFKRAEEFKKGAESKELSKKTLGLLFEKASTRTRVSFEVAMSRLGGHSIYLNPQDTQIGRGESIKDTAKTLSRYLDAVAIRAMSHETLVEFASSSTMPVINALTNLEHPCQALADIFTIKEKTGSFNVKLAYIGDGNNVCNSLIAGSSLVGMEIWISTPSGYAPDKTIVDKAKSISSSKINITNDPAEAVHGADVVYTDVWVSMGQEQFSAQRMRDFIGFQVNERLLRSAKEPWVMHCLPAKRGEEISKEVIDGPRSIVFDQAENRLHVQMALLELVMA